MITKNEAKTMTKHISCDCKCKSNSTTCKYGITKQANMNVKIIHKCKKDYSCNPSTSISENSKYLKSIADISLIECDEIKTVIDIVRAKMTNTILINITNTVSINCQSKKSKRWLYFAFRFISNHVTIDNYYYLLLLSKAKKI